jgi:prepilin-type N-terminal cleavage/methylation domain-containing protein
MSTMRPRPERGMTLVEITVVLALAAVVMTGLVGFYVSSQAIWMDGASQALTQRDATLLVTAITDSIRTARRAVVSSFPDSLHQTLTLYSDEGATAAFRCFYWRDSLVCMGGNQPAAGDRAVVSSRVGRFQLSTVDSRLVLIDLVELPSPGGRSLCLSSAAALYNR